MLFSCPMMTKGGGHHEIQHLPGCASRRVRSFNVHIPAIFASQQATLDGGGHWPTALRAQESMALRRSRGSLYFRQLSSRGVIRANTFRDHILRVNFSSQNRQAATRRSV